MSQDGLQLSVKSEDDLELLISRPPPLRSSDYRCDPASPVLGGVCG